MSYRVASPVRPATEYLVNASVLCKTNEQDWFQAFDAVGEIQVDASTTAMFSHFSPQTLSSRSDDFSTVIVTPDSARFQNLVNQWRKERGVTSSPVQMALCAAYQRIIAMGPIVIPFILRQLESEGDDPDHWFWALHHLTDADPVPADDRGDMKRMAAAWLDWGRRNFYAW